MLNIKYWDIDLKFTSIINKLDDNTIQYEWVQVVWFENWSKKYEMKIMQVDKKLAGNCWGISSYEYDLDYLIKRIELKINDGSNKKEIDINLNNIFEIFE